MKTAIIFPGQGSQYQGMGKDLYEKNDIFKETIDKASEVAGFDIADLMLNADEETLARTEIIQPILAAFGAGVFKILSEKEIKADYVAGLSLGEYSALYASGVFDLETLIKLTSFRGKVMEEAGRELDTKMCAVIGTEPELIEKICEETKKSTGEYVAISNYNCKGQTVISGIKESVEKAAESLKAQGARCIPLKVSSAFHTEFMAPAAEKLRSYFQSVKFGTMNIPVIFNVTGREKEDTESIHKLLEDQVKSPVRMHQTIDYLAKMGVTKVIETGPGNVIGGFIRKTAPKIVCVAAEKEDVLN